MTSIVRKTRRKFLQATGVTLALPMLESMHGKASDTTTPVAQRLVCIGTYLGFYQKAFYPKESGFNYETSELLKPIDNLRDDFTVFSGLDHRAGNGHGNWSTFLAGQKNNKITLDQVAAPRICKDSRFESLQISAGKVSRPMNFTKTGIALPMIERPSVLYKKLFSSPDDRQRLDYLLDSGQSALDSVKQQAQRLRSRVSKQDQQKLEEYFSALRDVERRVTKQRENLASPRAKIDYKLPDYDPIAPTLMLECENIMYDLMALALQTDSSRVITLNIGGLGQVRAGFHTRRKNAQGRVSRT